LERPIAERRFASEEDFHVDQEAQDCPFGRDPSAERTSELLQEAPKPKARAKAQASALA
jgi:hypothetical protein